MRSDRDTVTTAEDRTSLTAPASPAGAGYREVLADRSFQALSAANFISLAGDHIARVALSVLVFDRTSSAALTGLTYALSYLPTVVGGPLLAGLADRRPRRSVMIGCDLIRVVLVLLMATPALPLAVLLALLAVVTLFEAPFDAARGAMMPDVLPGERYAMGGAVGQVILQAAMVAGFAAGGALLIVATPRELLALDSLTFIVSAGLVRLVPCGTAAAEPTVGDRSPVLDDLRVAVRTVFSHPQLRPLLLLAWTMSAAAVAPEALAVPYAHVAGEGAGAVGLLLAAGPIGNVVAGLTIARLPEHRRLPLLWPLSVLAAAPLAVCLLHPPFPLVVGLVIASGMGTAFHLVAMVRFVTLVDPRKRGRALGLAGTGLAVGQGLAIALAGVLGDALDPAVTVGLAGLCGIVAAMVWGPRLSSRPRSQLGATTSDDEPPTAARAAA
jgi:MFS family permease